MALRKRKPEVTEMVVWKPTQEQEQQAEYDVRISVSKELREHYDKIITTRDYILGEELSEDKSVIGILNATTNIIKELSKIQEELYNSEKFAVFQQKVINAIKEAAPEVAEEIVTQLDGIVT